MSHTETEKYDTYIEIQPSGENIPEEALILDLLDTDIKSAKINVFKEKWNAYLNN